MNSAVRAIAGVANRLGESMVNFVERLGGIAIMYLSSMALLFKPPFRFNEFIVQMEFIGVKSAFIVILTGTFTGMVFAVQTAYAFGMFNLEYLIGPSVLLSLTRELSPVLTALMVTARAGSAMTTEIGYMRENEQIDALQTMSIHPIQYLVTPRVVATTIMMPLLAALFTFCGTLGAYFVTVFLFDVTHAVFVSNILQMVDLRDLYTGEIKAVFFGMLISTVCCYYGYNTKGGARGVGIATTQAVVVSAVSMLILDYFLTVLMY